MLKKMFGFDKGIHTLLLARILTFVGALWTVLQMTPIEPILTALKLERWTPLIVFGIGVLAEIVRRYKAEDV